MKKLIEQYIQDIDSIYQTGETTEHSFRGTLETLLKSLLPKPKKNADIVQIINEPKRKEYGAPDFELRKDDAIISFVETKDLFDKDLRGEKDKIHKEQFDRYKKAINTIAFTDYLEFVLYENGTETLSAKIAERQDGHIVVISDGKQLSAFSKLITKLTEAKPQPISSASILAEILAAKAKVIASLLSNALSKTGGSQTKEDKELHIKLDAFKKFLVHDMTEEQFADFYAQTIVYGMFIARIYDKTPSSFSLQEASELIPSINPFLKKIFKLLALAELHSGVKWIVEELVEIFKVTKMERILHNYGKDPLVHFYEDFLAEYNPKFRKEFGVWYTPKEVVSFIVDAVDYILRTELCIEDGLSDNSLIEYKGKPTHKVQILDPATGTGTFLAAVAEKIKESYTGQEGLWAEDVAAHIVPRLNAFEYLMAPYTMAHLKLATSLSLDKMTNENVDRLNIYLTNSLEENSSEPPLPFAKFITDESNAANAIKCETPVMVVMGNPPYNEKSANTGEWIMRLMDDYKQEPGMGKIQLKGKHKDGTVKYKNTLKGGNPKGLNNDYCKFIRLGQNFVERTQEGVLAYICGNTFLDTRLFRGMRYNLLKEFDDIYVVNLHGSSKRKEGNEATKDECIFNIMVGVSINIFVKHKDENKGQLAAVHYKDLYGTRREKLNYLASHRLSEIDFADINPFQPIYAFRTRNEDVRHQYAEGFSVKELMNWGMTQGVKTGRDSIVLHYTKSDTEDFCDAIYTSSFSDIRGRFGFSDTESEKNKYDKLRDNIKTLHYSCKNNICELAYRPFDNRWTVYGPVFMDRHRKEVQKNIYGKENTILCLGQEGSSLGDSEWSLVYCTDKVTDTNMIPRGGIYLFPMFIYDGMLKYTNFSPDILQNIEKHIGLTLQDVDDKERRENGFLAIDLIDYIYAVLHSVAYRDTYHDFLQNDFPTVPYPTSADYFFKMAEMGKKLRLLHAMKRIERTDIITTYPVAAAKDNNVVLTRKFEETSEGVGRVWINKEQYFDKVPSEAWNMVIAGYQPLDKWLKDRKDKHLTGDEILHYQKMVVALVNTIRTQEEIDRVIEL